MNEITLNCPCGHAAVQEHDDWRGCYLCLCERGPVEATRAALEAAAALPLVGGGQGRHPSENLKDGNALAGVVIWLGIAACIALLVLAGIWLCGHTDVAPFSELPPR